MHILVVNDDGPPSNQSSPYILVFVKTLQSAGHTVSVILPHEQRSWIGKAHIVGQVTKPTYFRPGENSDDGTTHSRPLSSKEDGEEWVLINGTPASATQLGLFHFFQDRGPVDVVVSGPNYGRNSTSLFSLSSGTIGGAMEGAICRKKSIALSYAFFSRDHNPSIIEAASRMSLKLIEHFSLNWDKGVDLYSINVPLVKDVQSRKVFFTYALQNYWKSGSSFTEIEASDDEDANTQEHKIRESGEVEGTISDVSKTSTRHKHKHFKWTPNFSDVSQSVEESEPGNDGWAIQQGHVRYDSFSKQANIGIVLNPGSITPLKANFMHTSLPLGELKLSSALETVPLQVHIPNATARLYAYIAYEDLYVQPLILSALSSILSPSSYATISSFEALPNPANNVLQITSYEFVAFDHLLEYPLSSLANCYVIRKALIRKHYLAHTIQSWLAKHPTSVLEEHVPLTVGFEVDYAEFLDEALIEAYELHEFFIQNEEREAGEKDWWILKPSMSDRGQGIRLFSSQEELVKIFEDWEEDEPSADGESENEADLSILSSASATTGESNLNADGVITSQLRHFVAQPYIAPLLLLECAGRKFHIRAYVLCVGALRVYVYKDMLALFAAQPYKEPGVLPGNPEDNAETGRGPGIDMRAHLTNTCLQDGTREGSVVRFWDLESSSLPTSALESIYDQICDATAEIFKAASAQPTNFQPLPNAFEVFGVDWLVDGHKKAWLLEVNAFPDFKQSGEEGHIVVEELWKGVLELVLRGESDGKSRGFFQDLSLTVEDERKRRYEDQESVKGPWELKKVLDLDLGRR
ncbi:MAG: hypothetical protein Q9167_004858 [Letrouitia subvulpina]